MLKTKELKKRRGVYVKRELSRQFWKLSPVTHGSPFIISDSRPQTWNVGRQRPVLYWALRRMLNTAPFIRALSL